MTGLMLLLLVVDKLHPSRGKIVARLYTGARRSGLRIYPIG